MNRRAIRGFGLVELMIAVLLGLMLSAALIQAYLASKNTYRTQDSLSEVQETGRYVINAITQDIRLSGQAGCLSLDSLYSQRNPPNGVTAAPPNYASVVAVSGSLTAANVTYTTSTMISGVNDVSAGTSYGTIPVAPDTDVLTIGRISSSGSRLVTTYDGTNNPTAPIIVEGSGVSTSIKAGATLLLGDCQKVAMFRASAVSNPDAANNNQITISHQATSGADTYNSQDTLSVGGSQPPTFKPVFSNISSTTLPVSNSQVYGGGMLLVFQQNTYFVGDTGRTTAKGLPIRALYVTSLNNTAMSTAELVSGVDNMQIEYQLATGQYVNAHDVPNFNQVVSVRISLLIKSTADNVVPVAGAAGASVVKFPAVHTLNETTQQTLQSDGRLAQQFFTVVAIRSRNK
jgi:type IV pilus assembly protein PilW